MKKRNKNWKKAACLLTMMCMLGSATACEMSFDQKDVKQTESVKEENGRSGNAFFEEKGLEVINVMKEKIHEEAFMDMLLADDLKESDKYQKLKDSSYDQPDQIYKITMANDAISNLLKIETSSDYDLEGMSASMKEVLYKQVLYSFMTYITSRSGVEAVALQGCLVTEKLFVSDEKNVNCIYLYGYEDQYPIAVVYAGSEDGAVLARGYFVISDDFNASSVEGVKEGMLMKGLAEIDEIESALGIQIEQIK